MSPDSSPTDPWLAPKPIATGGTQHARLLDKIQSSTALIGIIGLGYVGLPLARAFSEKGVAVLGFDLDAVKVEKLHAGTSYIGHISDQTIATMIENRFQATADFGRLLEPDVIIICVPTPLTESRDPDLSYIVNSANAIAARLRPGQLIVLESTTYPGTTREVVLPILATRALEPGIDYFVAYSPEREDPGNPKFSAPTIPKVVGGLDAPSLELAVALYAKVVVSVVPVSTPEVAEACKILENTYRAINIALVNELKIIYTQMGIDVWEVIEAARSKPFGFQAFYPGPGLGGHCIPIDPFYLTWVARKHGLSTRFIELAGEINTSMPAYVITRVADALNDRGKPIKNSKVALLGMAYKKDVDDPRESPGFALMDLLVKKGAVVSYNDPHIPVLPSMRHYPHLMMTSQPLTPDFLREQDCTIIVTDHSSYDWDWIAAHARLLVDTRNALKNVKNAASDIIRA
jgi:UDP-N-acetyl-D-glucosamine dehydrogenase